MDLQTKEKKENILKRLSLMIPLKDKYWQIVILMKYILLKTP